MSMTLGILNDGEDISEFNDTNITVIPKIKSPMMAKDYRPIRLCNTMFKLVSMTIVHRLKPFMCSIIHDSHSTFVEKRSITNNFIITFEAFYSMTQGEINGSNHFTLNLILVRLLIG